MKVNKVLSMRARALRECKSYDLKRIDMIKKKANKMLDTVDTEALLSLAIDIIDITDLENKTIKESNQTERLFI